jgi:hypothetical protein
VSDASLDELLAAIERLEILPDARELMIAFTGRCVGICWSFGRTSPFIALAANVCFRRNSDLWG